MPIRPPYLENGTSEAQIASIISGMEIPISSVKGAVTSVNGLHGDVKITPAMVDAQPKSALLSEISAMSTSTDSGMLGYSSGHLHMSPVSEFLRSLFLSPNDINFRGRLGLGSASVLDVNVPHGIPQLDDDGKIPQSLLSLSLSPVAKTGSYNDLTDKPTMVGQVNADWNATEGSAAILNKPTIPSVNYPVTSINQKKGDVVLSASDVGAATATHGHAIADVSGLQEELNAKRGNTPIQYSELQGAPSIPKDTADLTNTAGFITAAAIPAPLVRSVNSNSGDVVLSAADVGAAPANHNHAISGVTGLQTALDAKLSRSESIPYSQVTGTPAIPAGQVQSDWAQSVTTSLDFIKNKPVLFDGTWSSLTGKPTFSSVATTGSYADLLNKPVLFSGSYADLSNKPVIPAAQIQSDWNQTNTSAVDFIKNKPTIPQVVYPVVSVNGKTGAVVLSASDVSAAPVTHVHSIADITGLSDILASKITTGSAIAYSTLTGTPTIPTNTSQLVNGAGFVTSSQAATAAPVQSVNGKTGAVVLSAGDVGAATAASGTKYVRTAGTVASGVKVKYYNVTSDANGAWSVALGTDFTEVLDVQAQAVSTAGITGVRQSTVNAFTSTSTTITGMTWGNTVLVTILLSGTNSLSLTPNTQVRVRVEGVGP